jgi:molecular chaperone GrpE
MNMEDTTSAQAGSQTLEECQANLAAIQQENTELRDKYLRAAAAIDNARKQADRDATRRLNQRLRSIFLRLLEVADNLERTLDFVAEGDAIRPGIEATMQQLRAVLQQEGITPIHVEVGESFDPTRQEAITAQEADVDHAMVTNVAQRGYLFDGQVLRPARVVVTKPAQAKT